MPYRLFCRLVVVFVHRFGYLIDTQLLHNAVMMVHEQEYGDLVSKG